MGIGTIIFYAILAFIGYKILKGIIGKIKKSNEENQRVMERQKMLSTRAPKPVTEFEVELDRGLKKLDSGREVETLAVVVRMPESDWEGVKYLVAEEKHAFISCGNIAHVDSNFKYEWDELWSYHYHKNNNEAFADSQVNRRVNLHEIWKLKQNGTLGTEAESDCMVFKYHEDEYSTLDSFQSQVIEDVKHLKALIQNISVMESNKDALREGIKEKVDI